MADKKETKTVRLINNINGRKIGDVETFDTEYLSRYGKGTDYLEDVSEKAFQDWLKKRKEEQAKV